MPMMMLRAAMEGVARSIEVLLKELILHAKNKRGCTYIYVKYLQVRYFTHFLLQGMRKWVR
jgi:ABC-type antimicrobial peptide transport system ATPase subunit